MSSKLANIIKEQIRKQARTPQSKHTKLLDRKKTKHWNYSNGTYDFEIYEDEPMYNVDVFDSNIAFSDDAFLETREFNSLAEAQEFIKNYK